LTVCRRAVGRLSTGSDRSVLARMYAHLANVLANSGVGADSDELGRAVEESITIAHATGNPTTIAYAYFIAFATGATGPARMPEAAEVARAYAGEVDNRWVRTMVATVIALRGDAASDEAALTVAFDAAEDLHRTGWSTLAWFAMWDVIAGLFDLGRTKAAAMMLGGCESSGVSRMAGQRAPAELDEDSSTAAPYRHLGSQLRFDDLLAIAAGRRQLPLLP
jgi:hypothetical protein